VVFVAHIRMRIPRDKRSGWLTLEAQNMVIVAISRLLRVLMFQARSSYTRQTCLDGTEMWEDKGMGNSRGSLWRIDFSRLRLLPRFVVSHLRLQDVHVLAQQLYLFHQYDQWRNNRYRDEGETDICHLAFAKELPLPPIQNVEIHVKLPLRGIRIVVLRGRCAFLDIVL